ncbi:MAG: zinc dependent phospholipase C family protein [Chitinophagales bacterium]
MLKHYKFIAILCFIAISFPKEANAWGFWGHMRINRQAIFSLPPEIIGFYKTNIEYITEHAVDPDKRRYAIDGEAPRHFIDLDHFCVHPCADFPRKWNDAVDTYSEDTLQAYGIVPWHIEVMLRRLTRAFKEKNVQGILKNSTEIGHYISDSHVPLHTTVNYNGQLTNQKGIHGFWESRLPELFHEDYDFFVGKAEYIPNTLDFIWDNILNAHSQVEDVLSFEKELDKTFPSDQKYSYETRNELTIRTYSREYSAAYHDMMKGMVEEQMRLSMKHTADIWYTCWVNAGRPDMQDVKFEEVEIEEEKIKEGTVKSREHAKTGNDIFD